ncbi:MAG TPA: FAD-dependent oxidoreductase [Gaiellaceae bacterium]|nr:FAD-dependent oxidoreductase [Gaiellaceae bacterium]
METTYLIVGGGMTGDAAVKGIREHDADGRIVLVGAESHPPYKRPPLSKGLWSGGAEEKIWKNTAEAGAELVLGRRIVSLDPKARRAVDDEGDEYAYERVLLATGGTPRRLPGAESDRVFYYRDLDDFHRLHELAREGARITVIGGGFIGSELAASLTGVGAKVTMLFPEDGIAWRVLPPDLSAFVTDYYREKGVDVRTGESIASTDEIDADAVVAGLGIVPNVDLAEAAGLPVDNGIVVDEHGLVADGVYAAGDVANYPSPVLGKRFRVEHEDHANTHGKVVGANMAGAVEVYDHVPFFYSDMFDLGYEAVGEVDSRLATVETWHEPNRKGTIAYVDDDGRPRGFLMWNVWDKIDAARDLIRAGEPVGEGALV